MLRELLKTTRDVLYFCKRPALLLYMRPVQGVRWGEKSWYRNNPECLIPYPRCSEGNISPNILQLWHLRGPSSVSSLYRSSPSGLWAILIWLVLDELDEFYEQKYNNEKHELQRLVIISLKELYTLLTTLFLLEHGISLKKNNDTLFMVA